MKFGKQPTSKKIIERGAEPPELLNHGLTQFV